MVDSWTMSTDSADAAPPARPRSSSFSGVLDRRVHREIDLRDLAHRARGRARVAWCLLLRRLE
jgi:hypothetical protein